MQANLANQSRLLAHQTHALVSPLAHPPPLPLLDPLPALLSTLITTLPHPPSPPLQSLHALSALTLDLATHLSHLSDTLHITHQTSLVASRRLRAAKEVVEGMRRESELAEEGKRWLERGGWEERLKERRASREIGDVVGGFEEYCKGLREGLVRRAWESGEGVEVGAG